MVSVLIFFQLLKKSFKSIISTFGKIDQWKETYSGEVWKMTESKGKCDNILM